MQSQLLISEKPFCVKPKEVLITINNYSLWWRLDNIMSVNYTYLTKERIQIVLTIRGVIGADF